MANIRIEDLPVETTPVAGEFVPIDGASTRKTTIDALVNAGRPIATQSEAEGGTQATKSMTPLTTRQAIDFRLPSTELGRSLLNGASQAAIRAAIGAQEQSASLDSISGLTTSANQTIYTTGANTYATTTLTAQARELLGDADSAAMQSTLDLVPGLNVQEYSLILQDIVDGVTPFGDLQSVNNLSDLNSASIARTNLGLGDLATLSTINNAQWSGTDLAVANGGTGASDASTARTNLGLVIGANVQAYDAGLQSLAGLTTASNQIAYTTASDTYATTSLTAFARTILDDADASATRTTLGLGALATASTVSDADWSGADLSLANGGTGASTAAAARTNLGLGSLATQSSVSNTDWSGTDLAVTNGGTGASDASSARTNLGLAIGSNVQAYDPGLQSIAGLTTAANQLIYTTASDAYATTALTAFARTFLDDANAAAVQATLGLVPGVDIQANATFTNYAAFIAGTLGAAVVEASFLANGNLYSVVRDASGTITQSNGQKWRPNGDVTPYHFGAAGDGTTSDGAAVVAAASVGKDLKLPSGSVFNIDGFTITPVTGQKILGPGRLVKTNTADGGGNGSYTNPFIQILGVANVDVIGVEFFMPSGSRRLAITVEDSDRIRITGNRSLGNETFCFVWKNSRFVTVTENLTIGGQFGIATGGDAAGNTDGLVSEVIIANNVFSYASSEGIDINWDTQRCLISGNIVFRNNVDGPGANTDEIDIGGGLCRDITVINNLIDGGGVSATGILVKLASQYVAVQNNIVRNLSLTETNGRGIRFNNSTNGVLSGNQIYNVYRGISVDTDVSNVIVSGNRISGATSDGIQASNVSATSINTAITIRDNIINGCGANGIAINNFNDFQIAGNRVLTVTANGILVNTGCSVGSVYENNVSNADGTGINSAASKTSFTNNYVRNSGSIGISSTGIHCQVSNNHSFNNGRLSSGAYGISIGSGANFSRVCENTIYDDQGTKTQNGLRFVGAADRCVVVGNIAYNNVTTNITGTASLTNSVVDNNITA